MIHKIVNLCIVVLLMAASSVIAAEPEKEKTAAKAAELWLKLVDNGEFNKSWKEASEYLRNAVKMEPFAQSLKPVRNPLGKVITRKVKSTTYATSLPGAPDGEYVIVQFETSFENKKESVETVTPMLDKDGKWRVSGYFIK